MELINDRDVTMKYILTIIAALLLLTFPAYAKSNNQ